MSITVVLRSLAKVCSRGRSLTVGFACPQSGLRFLFQAGLSSDAGVGPGLTRLHIESRRTREYSIGFLRRAKRGGPRSVPLVRGRAVREGIGYSSEPGAAKTVYGPMFLRGLEPVALEKGQKIQLGLHIDLVGRDYIWRWETMIAAASNKEIHFRQSTFQDANLSPQSLRRQASFRRAAELSREWSRWQLALDF
jgi:hypothetical protein